MDVEDVVAQHYTRSDLTGTIDAALTAAGKDLQALQTSDLADVDEFHLGWGPQTAEFASRLGLRPGVTLLDVGSGIGGPARHFAEMHGCRVTGIDLTPAFVATAADLTTRTRLADRVNFVVGSALAMPFETGSFDRATLIHVGMNIAEKATLFREVRRVLRSDGVFGIFEVMRTGDGELPMPMPWADSAAGSFVETPETYRMLLKSAGFRITEELDRTAFVLDLAAKLRERIAVEGTPILGLHLVIGPTARERVGRLTECLQQGLLSPVEMIAQAE